MAPKENMKVMKTIDSDGEPCEKKKKKKSLVRLRLAEAEEETPRKMTLAEEEEADAERARKAARKMTLAEGAAARAAWEGTKGANGENSGVTPGKSPQQCFCLEHMIDAVLRIREAEAGLAAHEELMAALHPWRHRGMGIPDMPAIDVAARIQSAMPTQLRKVERAMVAAGYEEHRRQTTQMPDPMVDVAARNRSSMQQIGNAMVDEVRRILEAEAQDDSQTEDSGTDDGDTPEREPMVEAVLLSDPRVVPIVDAVLRITKSQAQTNDAKAKAPEAPTPTTTETLEIWQTWRPMTQAPETHAWRNERSIEHTRHTPRSSSLPRDLSTEEPLFDGGGRRLLCRGQPNPFPTTPARWLTAMEDATSDLHTWKAESKTNLNTGANGKLRQAEVDWK